MRCTVCKKTSEETTLYSGILESDMVMICEACAEDYKVPIIKKPSTSQLDRIDQKYSVRERMEVMAGMRERIPISEDLMSAQGTLAKLRSPMKKQMHEDVLDNYSWTLSMARRRRKMTANQLSKKMQVAPEIIRAIEKGIIPKDFEPLFIKLEVYMGIKLLKLRRNTVNFTRHNSEAERKILESVEAKMNEPERDDGSESDDEVEVKKDKFKLTLNDLVDIKKRREARIAKRKAKEAEDEMVGDDLDMVEIEEL